jgi:hypothetical protein
MLNGLTNNTATRIIEAKIKVNKKPFRFAAICGIMLTAIILMTSCSSKPSITTTTADDVTSLDFAQKIMQTQISAAPVEDAGKSLEPELSAKYPDTFGGLWVEYTPKFHFVVAFTSGGEEAVQPYRQGLLADAIEVRIVKYPYRDLQKAQTDIMTALNKLNIEFNSGIMTMDNVVELDITKTDMPSLNVAVQAGHLLIPDCVKIVPVDALAGPL